MSEDDALACLDTVPRSRIRNVLRRVPGVVAVNRLRLWAVDFDFRETARLAGDPPAGLFQPNGYSLANRYPGIFNLLAERIGDGADRALLSFGCSTGDELLTLRRFFPQAALTGIDASVRRIAVARRRTAGDPRLRLLADTSADALPEASFDAVLAMAVFRHTALNAAPPRCDTVLRFAEFEAAVSGLARRVRPGGLLLLRHANFDFADTAAARDFEPVLRRQRRRAPLYGPDDGLREIDGPETIAFRRRD